MPLTGTPRGISTTRCIGWRFGCREARGPAEFEALDSTFVRIDTDEGAAGWGEGCPWGHSYLPAFGAGARPAIALLAPEQLGQDPGDIDSLNRVMDRTLPGHAYANSPIDIALLDITGRGGRYQRRRRWRRS